MALQTTKAFIRKWAGALSAVVLFAVLAPASHASSIDLYDFGLSVSGGTSGDWQDISTIDPTTLLTPGSSIVNDTNCCGDASGGTTQGLGTFSYIFNPGVAGTYNISFYLDYDVSSPFENEYGTINNAGSAQAGVTGEIFNASSGTSNIQLFSVTGNPGAEVYGLANGSNNVPGQVSNNPAGTCTAGASCNNDVGAALTYVVTLNASQEAILSATASIINPGGFNLQLTHPADTDNLVASNVYITGSDVIQTLGGPPPPGTPEPSTWVLFGSALAALSVYNVRRRNSRRAN